MRESSVQFDRKTLLGVLSVLTFGLTALTAVAGLEFLTPAIFVLGFFIVVPLVALLGDSLPIVEDETDGASGERKSAADDPVDELRSRYASGELTHEEFERRLERLLETEDIETVGEDPERTVSRERVFERE
ncbi:SHOCT domain-containing protein [Halorussus amylolyticus]|uniref:SHOCT domain-containing protein n=1 Tax=Halorussus amylolyticus TaxID=1126242 RepID=UPI00104ABD4F|nr:SHOCT domain-containing protein [Halorussus amylolyticus]